MVKVTLRLDDGSIVQFADDGVASRIAVNKAIQGNKLGEKDCARLEQFIATARNLAPKGSIVEFSALSMVRFDFVHEMVFYSNDRCITSFLISAGRRG